MTVQIVNLQPLNAGGNGDLFMGQRSDTRERVVVKFLREYHIAYARKAFAREVRILARGLSGFIPLLFADTNAERPYYVMPYQKGGALTRFAGKLTDSQLHNVATEMGVALAALHRAFAMHGDVKPDNILVTQDGRLQIADPLGNGIGCTISFSDRHGGTPGYWAPEVRTGGSISYAGDVYSYGATLYHLHTGRKPQDGQGLHPFSESSPKIWEIIAACCQTDPNARPTIHEVLHMLRGEHWADIQAARARRQELMTAACLIGIFVFLGTALTA
jgi:serine/threonine protein kinase